MKLKDVKKLKDVHLSNSEKEALFSRISSTLAKSGQDIKFNHPVPSPFFKFFVFPRKAHAGIGAAALFLLLLTSATAYASLDTLPGDLLYGVKTNVVEKIPRALYFSSEKKAKDNFQKIEKRIDEFEKLAERGRLTEANTKKIEKNIDKNLESFDKEVQNIKKERRGKEEGLERELESRLEKQSQKIKKAREGANVSDKHALQSVIERAERSREDLKED